MVDVNFTEYGQDSLRILTGSTHDILEFGANSGYEIGVIIGLVIVLFLIIFAFAFVARHVILMKKGI